MNFGFNNNIQIKAILIIHLFLYSFNSNVFYNIEKISDNGDFLVVLNNGLYIYNFENHKCEKIKNFENSPFDSNEEYNNVLITKKTVDNFNGMKIAILVNQYLYVYTKDNLIKNIEENTITSIIDSAHYIYPFNIQIDDYKLIINLVKYKKVGLVSMKYVLNSYKFENYLSIKNDEPLHIDYDDNFTKKLYCYTINTILIKCVYVHAFNTFLEFITVKKSGNSYSKENEINIEEFNQISYNFEKECKELKSYYFNEKNEFILLCKKSNDYYIYIFNENNMNKNIQQKTLPIKEQNYKGKYSIIFNKKINNYDFVYDGNFTETCENFNNAEIPSTIQENKDSSYFFFSDKTIEEKTTHS